MTRPRSVLSSVFFVGLTVSGLLGGCGSSTTGELVDLPIVTVLDGGLADQKAEDGTETS